MICNCDKMDLIFVKIQNDKIWQTKREKVMWKMITEQMNVGNL